MTKYFTPRVLEVCDFVYGEAGVSKRTEGPVELEPEEKRAFNAGRTKRRSNGRSEVRILESD